MATDGRVAARLGGIPAKADIWNVESQQRTLEIVVVLVLGYSLTSGDCDAATGHGRYAVLRDLSDWGASGGVGRNLCLRLQRS